MHYIFIFILLFNFGIFANGPNNSIKSRAPRRRSIVSLIFSNTTISKNVSTNRTATCRWLRGYKHQNKVCRKRKGLSEVLLLARHLAINNCEEQFRYDRWNCSYKKNLFKKVYRETAFLQAISSSAIMYSVAKACADGKLHNCKCADQEVQFNPKDNWKWGGCGDNSKQAKKITSKFLQLRQNGDVPKNVLNYNSFVGLKITSESETKVCKCHGISGSCVMKTCWKSLNSFNKIAENIKQSYHSAVQQNTKNAIKQTIMKMNKGPQRLLYLSSSPNFCSDTSGRRCKDLENCATLCCGRGFEIEEIVVRKHCRCRWQDCCYDVVCDTCSDIENIYTCK